MREENTTFMRTVFTQQDCPKCDVVFALLALGQDAKRNTVVCQFCAHPEFFLEEEQTDN